MDNFFKQVEEEVLWQDDNILFNTDEITKYSKQYVLERINEKEEGRRGFFFEEVVCDFFEYVGYDVVRSKKTRDHGLDGVVETDVPPLGKLKLGLQAKWKMVDSTDVDQLLQALENAEIRLGVLVCRESSRLDKYKLTSKVKAILFFHNMESEVKDLPDLDVNPAFIMKFDELIKVSSEKIRGMVKATYKR